MAGKSLCGIHPFGEIEYRYIFALALFLSYASARAVLKVKGWHLFMLKIDIR